jgi:hypothetical protein
MSFDGTWSFVTILQKSCWYSMFHFKVDPDYNNICNLRWQHIKNDFLKDFIRYEELAEQLHTRRTCPTPDMFLVATLDVYRNVVSSRCILCCVARYCFVTIRIARTAANDLDLKLHSTMGLPSTQRDFFQVTMGLPSTQRDFFQVSQGRRWARTSIWHHSVP